MAAWGTAFLRAEWRDLAMLNYAVAPDILAPFVPRGTELDTFDGVSYVSVVGFRFVSTRVLGAAIPGHVDFEEVNLRLYVRRRLPDGETRRGVVFIRELVPRRAIAWVARAWYNEPYRSLPMRHSIDRGAGGDATRVSYEWCVANRWEGIELAADGALAPLAADSEAEFITEHYWGYTRQRDGSTIEYQVEHPRWRVASAQHATLTCEVASLYGAQFADALACAPRSAFIADGSAVIVRQPVLL